jgi:membrane protein
VFDSVLQALGRMWGTGAWQAFAQALNTVIAFGLTTTVFALIYKFMPRGKIEWHDVWVGAAVTAVLFTFGKFLISLYIGRSAVASAFGAAGSLAVVMIWVYYSAQIFLLGAEFTWVYAHSHGSRKGQLRPGEIEAQPAAGQAAPVPAPVRIAPAPLPPMPVRAELPARKPNPVVTFSVAAALGALAGILYRVASPQFVIQRRRNGLLSRFKLH